MVQRAFLHHHGGTAVLPERRAFFRRLEQEHHRATQLRPHAGEHFRRAHQHGGMRIVAAGMHDTYLLPAILCAHRGSERQACRFRHRQRVHVRTQSHHGPGQPALQDADDARMRHPGAHFVEFQRPQLLGYQRRGSGFTVTQLRVLVNVMAPGDDLRLYLRRTLLNVRVECGRRGGQQTASGSDGEQSGRKAHDNSGRNQLKLELAPYARTLGRSSQCVGRRLGIAVSYPNSSPPARNVRRSTAASTTAAVPATTVTRWLARVTAV